MLIAMYRNQLLTRRVVPAGPPSSLKVPTPGPFIPRQKTEEWWAPAVIGLFPLLTQHLTGQSAGPTNGQIQDAQTDPLDPQDWAHSGTEAQSAAVSAEIHWSADKWRVRPGKKARPNARAMGLLVATCRSQVFVLKLVGASWFSGEMSLQPPQAPRPKSLRNRRAIDILRRPQGASTSPKAGSGPLTAAINRTKTRQHAC